MSKSNIRIVSDGTAHGTFVYGADGKPLAGIKSVCWECRGPSSVAIATIEFVDVAVEFIGESDNER